MTPLTKRELAKIRMYGPFMLLPLMALLFAWDLWQDSPTAIMVAIVGALFGIYEVARGRWPREARVGLLGFAGIYVVFLMFLPQLLWASVAGLAAGLVIFAFASAVLWMTRQAASGNHTPYDQNIAMVRPDGIAPRWRGGSCCIELAGGGPAAVGAAAPRKQAPGVARDRAV